MSVSLWEKRNKVFLGFYFITTGACCVASELLLDSVEKSNFYFGQFFFFLSFFSLVISVQIFLLKKSIALLLSLIILKWPVLIYIVYQMAELIELHPLYLSAGVLPLVLSAFGWSLFAENEVI